MTIDPQALANEAIKVLTAKGLAECPRCKRQQGWTAEVLGILVQPMEAQGFGIPPPYLPSVILTCKYCAFMSAHNLKVLGVLS
jgi:hypothetical protein